MSWSHSAGPQTQIGLPPIAVEGKDPTMNGAGVCYEPVMAVRDSVESMPSSFWVCSTVSQPRLVR